MKKSNLELILEFLRDLLDYLHNHKWQGRIIAVGASVSMILWSLRFCGDYIYLLLY